MRRIGAKDPDVLTYNLPITMNQQFITDNFCNAEISKALKELGFNEPCLACYNLLTGAFEEGNKSVFFNKYNPSYASAPLYQQAIKWVNEQLIENKTSSWTVEKLDFSNIPSIVYKLNYRINILKSQ